ncbi:hypothetical protein MLD38_037270 [Melastoma candidum]|uniref:Uncharacterized protein n=1 Tax=Melastoma candidum TaxID=119954 RepID=A0ACB9LMJ4_9MYRT|nr:hypothetical protein MLD38_037270 [Melastoma candidum]
MICGNISTLKPSPVPGFLPQSTLHPESSILAASTKIPSPPASTSDLKLPLGARPPTSATTIEQSLPSNLQQHQRSQDSQSSSTTADNNILSQTTDSVKSTNSSSSCSLSASISLTTQRSRRSSIPALLNSANPSCCSRFNGGKTTSFDVLLSRHPSRQRRRRRSDPIPAIGESASKTHLRRQVVRGRPHPLPSLAPFAAPDPACRLQTFFPCRSSALPSSDLPRLPPRSFLLGCQRSCRRPLTPHRRRQPTTSLFSILGFDDRASFTHQRLHRRPKVSSPIAVPWNKERRLEAISSQR